MAAPTHLVLKVLNFRKKSKIGTFTHFLDLQLADSILRVLAELESAILVLTLYRSLLPYHSPSSVRFW
jgi:hypothetical protein